MNFIFPHALYLFILIPIFILVNISIEKKKTKDLIPFGNLEVLSSAILKTKKIDLFKHFPFTLKILILILLIFAIARPVSTIQKPVKDAKIMLLIDNSISMEATDIEPNRVTAARETAKSFVRDLPNGIQIGLGFFSGTVKILVNPTLEKNKILNTLDFLTVDALEPGTAIGDAIIAGSDALTIDDKTQNTNIAKDNRILVLITDGEANIGTDPLYAVSKAKLKNVIIQAIGIGNPMGIIIRGGILTRLDEFTLREVSSQTGGYYFNAQNLSDMSKIYKKIKQTIRLIPEEEEITFIPLTLAFVLLSILQILKWTKFRFV